MNPLTTHVAGRQGGCRCGAVRYAVALERLPAAYACHCLDCQTWSGSAFSEQLLVPESTFSVTGETTVYELQGPSGNTSRQRMCPTCHTRIFNTNSGRPGQVILRAGTLDASDELDVVAHIWTKRKQRWIAIQPGVAAWPETAPGAELLAALARG